jgi:hypothetical protein
MKTRQFRKLAGMGFEKRLPLLVEGLNAIAVNVGRIAAELEICKSSGRSRASELLLNIGKEEAGKYLILIDSCRAPGSNQATVSRHFARAGDHLAKLIYAEVADYAIASQAELLRAIEMHRAAFHLDGPNDFDWIFPNQLIAEREGALYVDLVEYEGGLLSWVSPIDDETSWEIPRPMRLVEALAKTGIVSPHGLLILQGAWRDFDAITDTHYQDWAERTRSALETLAAHHDVGSEFGAAANRAVELWPMPMVELELARVDVTPGELIQQREERDSRWMPSEYGLGPNEGFDP